jgi:hypothetical protein
METGVDKKVTEGLVCVMKVMQWTSEHKPFVLKNVPKYASPIWYGNINPSAGLEDPFDLTKRLSRVMDMFK